MRYALGQTTQIILEYDGRQVYKPAVLCHFLAKVGSLHGTELDDRHGDYCHSGLSWFFDYATPFLGHAPPQTPISSPAAASWRAVAVFRSRPAVGLCYGGIQPR